MALQKRRYSHSDHISIPRGATDEALSALCHDRSADPAGLSHCLHCSLCAKDDGRETLASYQKKQ